MGMPVLSRITGNTRLASRAALLLLAVITEMLTARLAIAQGLQVNPAAITLRRAHADTYQPEQPFSCSLVLDGMDARDLKALGIRETIPEGWEFMGLIQADAPPPAVVPPAGSTGTLEFAWIDPPTTFPYTLAYTVRPPADATGQRFFHGAVEYRLLGGPQYAPPVVTSVNGPENPLVLTLLGDNPVEIPVGTPWSEPGYTATDGRGQDVTSQVTVSGTVNTEAPGTYTLEYRLALTGQPPVTTTRTVIVTETNSSSGTPTPPARRPGSASLVPPPVEGIRHNPSSNTPPGEQHPLNSTDQLPAPVSDGKDPASEQSSLPELPSLDALRPMTGQATPGSRVVTVGLSPEQRADLPPEASRPFPPRPEVDSEAVRADILRAIEEEEGQARESPPSGKGPVSLTGPTLPPSQSIDWLAVGLGLGVIALLGSGGVMAGKKVYNRSAWRGPRRPPSG